MDAVDRAALEERPEATVFEFAGLRLDVARRELKRDDTCLPLHPRAFDALVVLVSRRGEVVEKTTLLDALWPGLSVEENSVAKLISDLRKALGPAASCIATVQRYGYRLDSPVRVVAGAGRGSGGLAKRALAVLPFSSLGGESERQLAFGLADALISRLSRLNDIVVRPTSSVARFADSCDAGVSWQGAARRNGPVRLRKASRRHDAKLAATGGCRDGGVGLGGPVR